jgi:hypothetical protein
MIGLTDEQILRYFHRSFTAVDGLWFLKNEERHGFDEALETDRRVWEVLPKIQARMIKSFRKMDKGIDSLRECLTTKLILDGFEFKTIQSENGFEILIKGCPWHNILIQSKRSSVSAVIGKTICGTEYSVWAAEFDDKINFEFKDRICEGARSCILKFAK